MAFDLTDTEIETLMAAIVEAADVLDVMRSDHGAVLMDGYWETLTRSFERLTIVRDILKTKHPTG